MSETIKLTIPRTTKLEIQNRAKELGLTVAEYLRTLVYLDITTQNYQKMTIYTNVLYNHIIEYQKTLDIHCTPVQEIPSIKFEEIETIE